MRQQHCLGFVFVFLNNTFLCCNIVANMHGFCLPERRKFYQDVSISQGESKFYLCSGITFVYTRSNMCFVSCCYLDKQFSYLKFTFVHFIADGLYEVNLDRRKLKTPGGKLFTVPNEALAIAVATEWDAQRDTLKSYTMHLVRLIVGQVFVVFFISDANIFCICSCCCGFYW